MTGEKGSLKKAGYAQRLAQSRLYPILVIAGAGIFLTLPVIIYGIPFFSDDGVTHHGVWYTHFSEQLWAGDLYPRWLMGMNEGLGSPVFYYYPPVPFFITSLLKPFFPGDVRGWHQLGVSASVGLIASGLFAYLWLKDLTSRNAALAAALLYMATPYHLASDLYIRSSFAEYWAFVWMPLILFFVHKILSGRRMAVAGLTVSYALLVMTHLPTTLIFSPIPLCYTLYMAEKGRRLKTTGLVAGAMTLGTGLSAIYLWPAMTTQQLVFLNRMSTGYFSYRSWLFFSNFSLWLDERLPLLLLSLDLLIIGCSAFIITRANSQGLIRRINLFWLVVVLVGVFMMTELSNPIWLILPALQKIQFPWRINAILSLATTALLALALFSFKKSERLSLKISRISLILLILSWIPATGWAFSEAYPIHPEQEEINYKNREIAQSREVPEYYPRWNRTMAEFDWEASMLEESWDEQLNKIFEAMVQRVGKSEAGLSKVKIVEGEGEVRVDAWKAREIRLHVKTETGVRLYLSQFYFPNWTARLAADSSSLSVEPSQPDGLVSILIPKGEHQILVRLERSRAETIGEIVSLISLVVLLAYLLITQRQLIARRK